MMAEYRAGQTAYNDRKLDFRYLTIPSEARTIRLLTVYHHDSNGLLHCSLSTARLDDLPSFIALSYTWGEQEATQDILLNGSRFMIRPNLYDFLDTVATQSLCGELLFVDAICIDQSNVRERESQISYMRDIYRKASRVVAWLGPADGVLSEGLAGLKQSVRVLESSQLESSSSIGGEEEALVSNLSRLIDETERNLPGGVNGLAHESTHSGSPNLLIDLLNSGGFSFSYKRQFWNRVWIVQEILLARDLTIQVGNYAINPEDYLLGHLRQRQTHSPETDTGVRSGRFEGKRVNSAKTLLRDRHYWRRRIREGPPIQLYEVIRRFGFQKASDPLDQVFGFLGLAQSHVRADYRLTKIELYTYVLIEGAQHFNKPKITKSDVEALLMFHYACISALGFSATDTAVAAIMKRALRLCSIPTHIRFHVALGSLLMEAFDDNWNDTGQSHTRTLRWCVLLVQTLGVLGRIAVSYARLYISLQYAEVFDIGLTTTQRETRKYAAWKAFVDDSFIRVKLALPPRSAIPASAKKRFQDVTGTSSPIGTILLSTTCTVIACAVARKFW